MYFMLPLDGGAINHALPPWPKLDPLSPLGPTYGMPSLPLFA